MARRQFLVHYSNGSRKYIDREERDSLLYAQEIKEIAPKEYRYVARTQSCRLTATENTLQALAKVKQEPQILRRYLGSPFTIESPDGRRYVEMQEMPEAFIQALERQGAFA